MNTSAKKFFSRFPAMGGVLFALILLVAPTAASADSFTLKDLNTTEQYIRCLNSTGATDQIKWSNARAATCSVLKDIQAAGATIWGAMTGGSADIVRSANVFQLPATTTSITSAVLRYRVAGNAGSDQLVLTAITTSAGNGDLNVGDYDLAADTEFSSRVTRSTNVLSFTFNEAGLNYLNAAAELGEPVELSVRFAGDLDDAVSVSEQSYASTSDVWLEYESNALPGCSLLEASGAVLPSGQPTIYAEGTCANFNPTSAWLGAVRIDPVGHHISWSEGLGPFPDPYTLQSTDAPAVPLGNGTYRVRMYGHDGTTLYVSDDYQDVVITDAMTGFRTLTVHGIPLDEWTLDPNESTLSASTTGAGYTFSASAAAIAAAGGLGITADGCAAIGEDATSTTCVMSDGTNFLRSTFPLLTWPMGILSAFHTANAAVEDAPTAYALELPSHGDWIPAVIVVDSASRTKGIGAYIPVSVQDFFREVLAFGIWVAFVLRLKAYADEMIGRGNPSHTPGHV